MDDCASFPTCILKVNVGSCEECAAKLKKYLAKVDGVHGVDVDAEKGLVRVSGPVDPRKLIRKLAEKKMKAELLSYGDPIMISENKNCVEMQKKKAIHVRKDYHDFDDYVPTKIYEDFECRDSNCRFEQKKPIMHGNDHYVPMVKLHPPNPYRLPPPNPCRFPPPNPNPYRLPPPNPCRFPPPNPYRFPPAPPNLHHPGYYGRPLVPQYDHGGCRLGTDLPYRFPPPNPLQFSPPNTHWFPPAPPNLHYPQYYGGPIVPQYDSSGYCRGADHDASCMWPSLQPLPPYDHYGARHIPTNNDFTHFFSDENAAGCTVM
ncbi:uncharacterized protein LOC131313168 [Rhododendron vialii]|uniref:uncharacterized protein LOC131313168 n=1 Tax=Rhododendron vialii TaxID=182163 RepID=UPI00265E21D2|nr:uncharacterized protein LOC131313168 [Rhododendron vialii]